MGNDEYGPPPSGQPIGQGEPRPSAYPQGAYPPNAYPHNAYPQGTPPASSPQTVYPPPYPSAYPPPLGAPLVDKNWMGITSLVLGCLGGGLLGVVFGGMGISAANQGRANNKSVAVWGLALNIGLPILLVGGFVVFGLATEEFSKDSVFYSDVAVGECVQKLDGWDGTAEEFSVTYVIRVQCNDEHWGQVYHREGLHAGGYPGDDEVDLLAQDACYSEAALANIVPEHFDEAYVTYLMPMESSWIQGDRTAVCLTFGDEDTLLESWVAQR